MQVHTKLLTAGAIVATMASASTFAMSEPFPVSGGNIRFESTLTQTDRDIIINDLRLELGSVDDAAVKQQLEQAIAHLSQKNGEAFFDALDAIYEKLDPYFSDADWDDFDDFDDFDFDFNFSEEKLEIIKDVERMIAKIKGISKQASFKTLVTELKNINDEDVFFEKLDTIHEQLESHPEVFEITLDELKAEEIEHLLEEASTIEDDTKRAEAQTDIKALKNIKTEEAFFDAVDALFTKYEEFLPEITECGFDDEGYFDEHEMDHKEEDEFEYDPEDYDYEDGFDHVDESKLTKEEKALFTQIKTLEKQLEQLWSRFNK